MKTGAVGLLPSEYNAPDNLLPESSMGQSVLIRLLALARVPLIGRSALFQGSCILLSGALALVALSLIIL